MSRPDRCDVCGSGIMAHALGRDHDYVNAAESTEDVNHWRTRALTAEVALARPRVATEEQRRAMERLRAVCEFKLDIDSAVVRIADLRALLAGTQQEATVGEREHAIACDAAGRTVRHHENCREDDGNCDCPEEGCICDTAAVRALDGGGGG